MIEPIDRLNTLENLADLIFDKPNDDYFRGVEDSQRVVSRMPIVSPKQSEWVEWNGMDIPENHGKHKCSRCRNFAPIRYEKPIIKEWLSDYCPHCGATMILPK